MVEGTSSEISQSKNNKNSNYKKPYNKFNIRKNHYNNDNIKRLMNYIQKNIFKKIIHFKLH